jgi:hypothetical protein
MTKAPRPRHVKDAQSIRGTKATAAADARKLLRKANESARDQFAALGRFIQNFEFAVNLLRGDCSHIVMGGQRGITITKPSVTLAHWNVCSLTFHHASMTAGPLAEIWRALVIEQSKAMVLLETLSKNGFSVVEGVTTEIYNKFMPIADKRNKLIHATWSIGRWFTDDDFTPLMVAKYAVNKQGLIKRDDLPKTFEELMALGDEVNQLSGKLARFMQFYRYNPEMMETVFTKADDVWSFSPPKPSPGKSK